MFSKIKLFLQVLCATSAFGLQQSFLNAGSPNRLLQVLPGVQSRRALTEKTCYQSPQTCYQTSGILGAGCYSDPTSLGIDESFASNTAGSTASTWPQGFNYTPESQCEQACKASPLCGGFYFSAQNGVTCSFQSIEQASSQECLAHSGNMECSEMPSSGSQCWWNGAWPASCTEHYADVTNQEYMHWICEESTPENTPEPEELPFCECHASYQWTSYGEVCETHCMTTSGPAYCHPGNSDISDPLHFQPCGRHECWGENQVRCRKPITTEAPTMVETEFTTEVVQSCAESGGHLQLIVGQATAPNNLATQADLLEICGESCAVTLGLADWEVCGLQDGQLDGPLHGGEIEDPQQSGYGCWIQCHAEFPLPQAEDLDFNYITLGNGEDGFCRDASGVMKFLGDWDTNTEAECKDICNHIFACAGYQYGRNSKPLDCNLYYVADTVSSHTNTYASCQQKQGQLGHSAYVWHGRGYCRSASGDNEFLSRVLDVDEIDCRQACDEQESCAGFAYGTPNDHRRCNLYGAADTSSGKSGLGGCWAKIESL